MTTTTRTRRLLRPVLLSIAFVTTGLGIQAAPATVDLPVERPEALQPLTALAVTCATNPLFTGRLTASSGSTTVVSRITSNVVYGYISDVDRAWSCTASVRYSAIAWNTAASTGRFNWGNLINSTSVACNWLVGSTDFLKANSTSDCPDSDAEYAMAVSLTPQGVYHADVDHDGLGDFSFAHSDCDTYHGAEPIKSGVSFSSGSTSNRPDSSNCDPITLDGTGTSQTVTYDSTAPTGSVSVNAGAAYATSTASTLTLSATDAVAGLDAMRFSNDGTTWSAWETYGTSKAWTLATGDGTKTVRVQFRDLNGNVSTTYSDTIVLDTINPTGSISIAGGAAYTTSTAVTLNLTYADTGSGPYQMQFQNAGGAWSSWEAVAPTKAWTLGTGDGTKTVSYQVKDNAGRISTTYTDTIVLDTANPTASISVANGAAWTTSTSVTLNVSASDATSGVATTQASNDNVTYTAVTGSTPSWTLTSTNGTKTVWYRVTDAAGRSTTVSDTIGLDTVNPTATLAINTGAATTTSASVTLNVTASDATSGVAVTAASNDNVTFTPVSGSLPSWTLTSGDGLKTVWYRVTDGAGRTTTVSDTITLSTDTTAPDPPTVPDLVAASDTGTFSTDDVTNDTTPTFTGAAEAGAAVTIYDGATPVGSGPANGGAWTITTSVLSDGVHAITGTATDASSNTSAASAPLSVTIDTVAPAAPSAPDLVAASDTGSSSTDNVTSDSTPTVTGTAESDTTVTIYDGAAAVGSGAATGGTWTITTAILSTSEHTLVARATDVAGNEGPLSAALTLTIDTSAPAAPSTPDVNAASDTGASASDDITGDPTPTLTGTAETGATVTLYDGSTPVGSGVATGSSWTITSTTLDDGAHSMTARATDLAGNQGAPSPAVVVSIDTIAPTADFTAPNEGTTETQTAASYSVAWSENEVGSGVASRVIQQQSATIVTAGSCDGVTWLDDGTPMDQPSPLAASGLDVGRCYRWLLTIIDVAGESSGGTSGSVLIADGPGADFSFPDEETTTLNAGGIIEVDWTESGSITSRSLQRQRGQIVTPGTCATVTWVDDGEETTATPPIDVSGLADEHCYRWVLTLTDSSSQVAMAASGSLLVDLTSPTAAITSPTLDLLQQTGAVQIAWTEGDTASGVGIRYLQRQRMAIPADGTCTGFDWFRSGSPVTTASPVNVASLSAGCYRWQLSVVDAVGNMTTVYTPTLLVDPFAPTADFSSPNEGSVTPLGSTGLTVEWTEDADSGVQVAGRALQREKTTASGTNCGTTWSADGAPTTAASPLAVSGLLPDTCYRWVLTLTDTLGNSAGFVSGIQRVEPSVLDGPVSGSTLFDDEVLEATTIVAGVTGVEFLVDGVAVGTDSTAPYSIALATGTLTDGTHQLQVRVTTGGGSTTSAGAPVTIANALGSTARVESDYAAGELTLDEYVLYGIYAIHSEYSLPGRYQSSAEETGTELLFSTYLQYWDQLGTSTQSELTDLMSTPLSGSLYQPNQNLGGPEPDFGNCDNTHNADPFVVRYCFRDSARGHFTFMYVIGNATTESEVERRDENDNGVPDRVDDIEEVFEDAWDVYVDDMGFEDPMPGARINVSLAKPPDRNGKVTSFFPIPLPLLVSINPDDTDDEYLFKHLIPHELFHVVQFHYAVPIAVIGDERQGWYEATANWGAHQLLRETGQTDPDNTWTGSVGAYLGTSELELSKKSPWGEEREYAMQLVGEYLQLAVGENAIRRTWELIRDGKSAKEAIRDTVEEAPDPVLPFEAAWLDYARRAYEMDFPGVDKHMMRDKLAEYMTFDKSLHPVPDPANTDFDDIGSPRPARHRAALALSAPVDGTVPVEELGMGYVDLVPTAAPPFSGSITVQVELPDGDVATLVPYRAQAGPQPEDIDGPIECGTPQDFTFKNGIGTAEVSVDTGCPFATLIVARVVPPAVAGPAKWTATFNNNIVSNGTVQLGINRAGNLIVPSSVTSAGTLEPQVGLRLLSATNGPLDGISPDCDCEGWGIAASNLAGATAFAQNGSVNPVNMTVTEFSKTGQSATSRVLASGIFDVTHQFDPVPGQPHLYRITVTVTNVGVQDANVRYRRVMDWDVEPTAFDEYTTIGHFGNPPSSLVYSSNDGFQDADPMDTPTNASATGFYVDDGPNDWGAMFDFDFGVLAPNDTLTFELFYGAAPSEAIALAELQAVGAQVYSFGQPSSPGGKEFGQPVTFVFGMREVAGGGSSPQQSNATEGETRGTGHDPAGAAPRNRNDD